MHKGPSLSQPNNPQYITLIQLNTNIYGSFSHSPPKIHKGLSPNKHQYMEAISLTVKKHMGALHLMNTTNHQCRGTPFPLTTNEREPSPIDIQYIVWYGTPKCGPFIQQLINA